MVRLNAPGAVVGAWLSVVSAGVPITRLTPGQVVAFACTRALCGLLLVLTAAPAAATPTPSAADDALPVGATAEFELEVGQARRHAVGLEAGQLLHVEVKEKGPRVLLALMDDTGATLARRQAPFFELIALRLYAVAPHSGTYTLEVRSSGGRAGTYEIRMEEPRPSAARDRTLAAADDALAESLRLSKGATEVDEGALAQLDRAEAGFVEAGDRQGQALVMLNRCGTLDGPPAEAQCESARSLFRELGDREGEFAAFEQIGYHRNVNGDSAAARAIAHAAVDYAQTSGNRLMLAESLIALGAIQFQTGEAEKAVASFTQGVAVAAEAGDTIHEQGGLSGLTGAYTSLGDAEKGLQAAEQALTLARRTGHRLAEATVLNRMAGLHLQRGDEDRALALAEQALPLARVEGGAVTEAGLHEVMARVLGHRGDHARAIAHAERSLELNLQEHYRAAQARSITLIGKTLYEAGDVEAGRRRLEEALRIRQAVADGYGEVHTRTILAALERDAGSLAAALAQAEAAVKLLEELRSRITSPDLRASFVARQEDAYGIYMDVLMRLHERDAASGADAAALQASERARARVLLEALIEARADIREGVEPSLLERERALQTDISKASARLRGTVAEGAGTEAASDARRQLERKTEEYRLVQAEIRHASPRYAALTQPEPASVEQIRQEVLDDDTVLLEFHLGEDRSFLWALTRSALVSGPLPAQEAIEASARSVHALMTRRQHAPELAAMREADRKLEGESAALSRMLLGAIASRLETEWKGKRLLVVASGALAYLPFGALPAPQAAPGRPLLRDHEIVFAPSASVLLAQRRESASSASRATKVAVLADPVFEAADPRVRGRAGAAEKPAAMSVGLARAVESLGRSFSRLPFSRAEADAIARLVPRSSLLEATDFAASRKLVAEGGLGDRTIVHFATHGLLDSAHPDLSGLVLSLVDEKGTPQDGFLRMQDIYNLRLPADLVVLSACQTALGREIRGEGLVGLTRGFMYAGARRVVASLWQVDDESTAELMKRFYRAMLKDGRRPADALRTAQLEMSRQLRWSAPFYWAGFVLQGEWR